jgi:hypothetical protein
MSVLKLQGKKRTIVVKSFSSSDSEVTLSPLEKKLYIALEATPKNE